MCGMQGNLSYVLFSTYIICFIQYKCWLCCYTRGSVIAKIVGSNVRGNPNYEERITMYVYEEMIGDKKLSEIINTTHENVKYLPGIKLPDNVVSHLENFCVS